jgi:hypothetical protein
MPNYGAKRLINTYNKTQHFVFTGPSESINFMYTLWPQTADFQKNLAAISKTWCQNSDIKEVHNLSFRQCQGVRVRWIGKYLTKKFNLPFITGDN